MRSSTRPSTRPDARQRWFDPISFPPTRCIEMRGRTAHLEEGKLLVRGGLAESDAEVRRDGVDDLVRAATAEHARGGGADLDKVVADRFPVRRKLGKKG